MNETEVYELIAKELAKNKKEGLWLQCEIEADMDEKIAKKLYVKKRFQQILDEVKKSKDESPKNSKESTKKKSLNKNTEKNHTNEENKELLTIPDINSDFYKIIDLPFKEGDLIKEGDIICTIETSESFMELESPYDGKISKYFVKSETVVEPNDKLLEIITQTETNKKSKKSNIEDLTELPIINDNKLLKDFSRLYVDYKLLDFSDLNNISKEDFEFNHKLLFECFQILAEIGKNSDPNAPTTSLTFQVVTTGLIEEDRFTEVQLNLKEWQRLAKNNDEVITLRKVLRMYTGFNENEL